MRVGSAFALINASLLVELLEHPNDALNILRIDSVSGLGPHQIIPFSGLAPGLRLQAMKTYD